MDFVHHSGVENSKGKSQQVSITYVVEPMQSGSWHDEAQIRERFRIGYDAFALKSVRIGRRVFIIQAMFLRRTETMSGQN